MFYSTVRFEDQWCGARGDMGNVRTPEQRTEQRARILRVAAEVMTALHDLDLDLIDGEFYWRCARVDLREGVAELREGYPLLREQRFPAWDGDLFAFIHDGFELARAFDFLWIRASLLYPSHVWGRLVLNHWIPMRRTTATTVHSMGDDESDDVQHLQLRVFSGAWTGADVEREVQQSLIETDTLEGVDLEHPSEFDTLRIQRVHAARPPLPTATSASIRIEFRLVHHRDAVEGDGDEPHTKHTGHERDAVGPYVEVLVPYPPPPPGTVGREYDAVVRDRHQWHLLLPGAVSRQDKEVAVRTWAVGLLVGTGLRFGSAMRLVSHRCETPEVSQTRFTQDRKRLLERVPEATPYLFARA